MRNLLERQTLRLHRQLPGQLSVHRRIFAFRICSHFTGSILPRQLTPNSTTSDDAQALRLQRVMGDSDWPMQKGERTHRVPPGWIEKGRGCPSQKNTNGAGNTSRPICFVSSPPEADRLWLSRRGIPGLSDTCVPANNCVSGKENREQSRRTARRTVVRLSTVSGALRRHQHLPLLKHHRNTVFVCHAPISRKFAEQVG